MKKTEKNNNTTLKVLSLIMAIILWGFVTNDVNPIDTNTLYNIKLEIPNREELVKAGLKIIEPKGEKITVVIEGRKLDLSSFNKENIIATVDISGQSEGQTKYPIKVSLKENSDIKIKSFSPQEVLVTFDPIIEEHREVKIRTIGELGEGYVLGDLEANIDVVNIKATRSTMNEIEEIVSIVDVTGMLKDSSNNYAVRALDKSGNDIEGIELDIPEIEIKVPILRSVNVPINLVMGGSIPENVNLIESGVNPKTVTLKGDKSILNLKSIDTKEVNVENLIENENYKVELNLPTGISLLDPKEEFTAYVKLKEMGTKTISINAEDIEIKNLDKNYEFKILNDLREVLIVVRGDKDIMNTLGKEAFNVFVNLESLREGIHEVVIEVIAKEGITIEQILPQAIEIELSSS